VDNLAVEIIDQSVQRIVAAMKEGTFTREDLETVKKVFQEGIKATDTCLARGPKRGDVDDHDQKVRPVRQRP
jgi:hypothetical protein